MRDPGPLARAASALSPGSPARAAHALLLGSLALAACGKKETPAPPVAAEPPRSSSSSPAAAAPLDGAAAQAGEAAAPRAAQKGKPAPKALTDADKTKRHSFVDSLGRGRAATRARRYDDAIVAFTEAVSSDQDGRAYAERGYTYFLQKKYDLALKDLQGALEVPEDATLAAQVWFNLGLTKAAMGRAADADLAFFWSNRLNPTKAADAKLADRKVCPVAIDRKRTEATPYAGFLEWATAMSGQARGSMTPQYTPDPDEASAAARFCGDCKGNGPWQVVYGDFEEAFPRSWDVHLLARHAGKLWDYGVFGTGYAAPAMGEPCFSASQVSVGQAGKSAYVQTTDTSRTRVPMKTDDTGEISGECPYDSAWDDCRRICMSSASTTEVVLLDLARPARTLTLKVEDHYDRTPDDPPQSVVRFTPGATGFDLDGADCRPVPYAP